MHTETICQHLLVSGHVQRVGFRASLVAKARTLQLAGWVRNLRDGRVEAVVQGPEAAVQTLLQWCQRGPPAARVDAVCAAARPVDPSLSPLHGIATA